MLTIISTETRRRNPLLTPKFIALPEWSEKAMFAYELQAREATFLRMIDCLDPVSVGTNKYSNYSRFKALLIILAHEMFSKKRKWFAAEAAAYETYTNTKRRELKAVLTPILKKHTETLSSLSVNARKNVIDSLCTSQIHKFIKAVKNYLDLKKQVSPGSLAFSSSINDNTARNFVEKFSAELARNFFNFKINEKLDAPLDWAWAICCEKDSVANFRTLIEDEIAALDFQRLDTLEEFTQTRYELLCNQFDMVNEQQAIIESSKAYIRYNLKFKELLNETLVLLQESMPGLTSVNLSTVYKKAFQKALIEPAVFLKNFLCELYLLPLRLKNETSPAFLKQFKEQYIRKLNDFIEYLDDNDTQTQVNLHTVINWVNDNITHEYIKNSLESLVYASYTELHTINDSKRKIIGLHKTMLIAFDEVGRYARTQFSNDSEGYEYDSDDSDIIELDTATSHELLETEGLAKEETETKQYYITPTVQLNFSKTRLLLAGLDVNPEIYAIKNMPGVIHLDCLQLFNEEVKLMQSFKESFGNKSKSRNSNMPAKKIRQQAIDIFEELLAGADSIEAVSALIFVAERAINLHQSKINIFTTDTASWSRLCLAANNKALNLLNSKMLNPRINRDTLIHEIDYYRNKKIFVPVNFWGVISEQVDRFNKIVSLNQHRRLVK